MDALSVEIADLIAQSKVHLLALQSDPPTLMAGLQFSCPSSFQAATLRELLRHRMSDLTEVSVSLLDQGRVVPAAILARAAAETSALTYALHREVAAFLVEPNEQQFCEFLGTSLVGSRNPEHPLQAKNILGYIDKLSKEFPAFRQGYDALSEFAHPNWSGVLGAYGSINYSDKSVALGSRDNAIGLRAVALVTSSVLSTFSYYYDLLADSLREFDAHYSELGEREGGGAN